MSIHGKLRRQLAQLVESPEPTSEGDSYTVYIRDLLYDYAYIEFHFNYETGKVDAVQLIKED